MPEILETTNSSCLIRPSDNSTFISSKISSSTRNKHGTAWFPTDWYLESTSAQIPSVSSGSCLCYSFSFWGNTITSFSTWPLLPWRVQAMWHLWNLCFAVKCAGLVPNWLTVSASVLSPPSLHSTITSISAVKPGQSMGCAWADCGGSLSWKPCPSSHPPFKRASVEWRPGRWALGPFTTPPPPLAGAFSTGGIPQPRWRLGQKQPDSFRGSVAIFAKCAIAFST